MKTGEYQGKIKIKFLDKTIVENIDLELMDQDAYEKRKAQDQQIIVKSSSTTEIVMIAIMIVMIIILVIVLIYIAMLLRKKPGLNVTQK